MRVAVILEAVFPENKGGLERWFFHLASELSKNVESVHYLNSAGINREEGNVRHINITTHKWSYLDGGIRSVKQAVMFLTGIIKWTWTNSYDLIYISSVPILSIFAIPIIKLRNPKTVIIVEWLEYWPLRYWCSYNGKFLGSISWLVQLSALQFGDFKTTFISRTNSRIRQRSLPWLRKRTVLLPGLVNGNLHIKKFDNGNRNDLVFLGRLVMEKQPTFAVELVAKFIDRGWTGTFWIVGTGPEELKISSAIAKSGKGNQIKLIINATDNQVLEKFKSSFLLIHPSKREGYGLVCVEAAFQGLPALLIDYPENGAVDLLINPNLVSRSDKFSELLEMIMYAKSNFELESRKSIEWAANSFELRTIERSAAKILDLVEHYG